MSLSLNESSSLEALKQASDQNGGAVASVTGSVIKDLKGLEYGGELEAECNNCGKHLFTVMKISDMPNRITHGLSVVEVTKQKFQSNCPFCNGQSWLIRGENTLMIREAVNSTIIEGYDVGNPESEDGMFTKIQLVREKV